MMLCSLTVLLISFILAYSKANFYYSTSCIAISFVTGRFSQFCMFRLTVRRAFHYVILKKNKGFTLYATPDLI